MDAAHTPDTRHLQQHTLDLVAWMAQHPPWESASGQAVAKLYADATEAGLVTCKPDAMPNLLARLEQRGLIKRTVRGKRTYSVAAASQNGATRHTAPPELPPAPEAPPTAPAANDDAGDAGSEDGDLGRATTSLPVASSLVGTVRLELELDPAMARLVLDLIERGQGIRPIDRDTVQLMIDRRDDQATKRRADGMARIMDRLAAVEANVAGLSTSLRSVGLDPPSVQRTYDAAKVTKPDFRVLGVKDSQQRRLLTDMALDGWTFERANNGHVKATKDGHKSLQLACTPSDKRTTLNDRARARQAGAAV